MVDAVAESLAIAANTLTFNDAPAWRLRPVMPEGQARAAVVYRFLEFLNGRERIDFFNELDKSLEPGAKIHIQVPYYSHPQAFAHPLHQWPPFSEHSFLFFDASWRHAVASHTVDGLTCDLRMVNYEFDMVSDWSNRADSVRSFSIAHYLGVVTTLFVTLEKPREL